MKSNQILKSNSFSIMVIVLPTFLTGLIQSVEGQNYKLASIPLKDVRITDQFWAPRIEANKTVTVPLAFQKYEQRDNMCSPKMIEGASYSLQNHPDRQLEDYINGIIDKIAALQEDDGYLHLYREESQTRWSELSHSHELYHLGHLYEAAVAHYQAAGKSGHLKGRLLDKVIKNADLLCQVFGPDKKRDIPGHQEIELALVKLYKLTGCEKYLKLAKFFLDERGHTRGRKPYSHKGIVNYMQDHKSVVEQSEAVGHAVRAVYMYCGMVDVAAFTGDADYVKALDRIWDNVVTKKLYINGGVGVRWEGEAFGDNYELPNKTAHSETCAAIANVFWNHRMNMLHSDAKYIDVLELALYNRVLAGISLDGSSTFYKGPLASEGRWPPIRDATMRTPIMDNIHCCVTNIVRLIPQIGRYIYAADNDGIYVNLYVDSTTKTSVKEKPVTLTQQTRHPWDGTVKITVDTAKPIVFDLNLRIPGWCVGSSPVWGDLYRFADKTEQTIVIKINGKEETFDTKKGYARFHRQWKAGDVLEMSLPMPIRRVYSNPNVKSNTGRVVIMRGPLVYCAEGLDNDGHALNLVLRDGEKLGAEYRKDLLGGVVIIRGKADVVYPGEGGKLVVKKDQQLTLIPYYTWANRGVSEMTIWLARNESILKPAAPSTIASTSRVTALRFWDKMRLHAYTINDQLEPKSSNDRSVPQFNWWPLVGISEWLQYDFLRPEKVSAVKVYWFDEQPDGGCRAPKSWRLLYKDGFQWKPVAGASEYGIERDRYNRVTFDPVETTALRIEFQMQPDFSTGILEWQVEPSPVNPPLYTDYCAMLSQEIQGKKHGFMAGNKAYYIGGQYSCWRKQEDETIGLTHPFFHDLRSRGYGMVQDSTSGYGHDLQGWEFYRHTKVAYGTVIVGQQEYANPVPTTMYWRPDKMICEYTVGGANIHEEKFISLNDVACSIIKSDSPITIKFKGQSYACNKSIKKTASCELDAANNTVHVVECGTVMVKPHQKEPPTEGVLMYDGMSTAVSASRKLTGYRQSESDGQWFYEFKVSCDSDGVTVVWAMDDEYSNALNRAKEVLADPAGKLTAKTKFMNDLLNYQIPYFRCSNGDIVDIYYYLWSLYFMYFIDVEKGWEQYPHTQTAVNNFLGLHRYDAIFQILVGSWAVDKKYYAYGNVLLWKALLPYTDLSTGNLPADNMGQAWLCSDCPGPATGHVQGAWQIYQHTGDLDFLREVYIFYKALMWQRIPGHWGYCFNAAECLAKMAKELGCYSDSEHWYKLVDMDNIDRWLKARWEIDTPHFFASSAGKMDWSNMAYMGINRFPDDWAAEMTENWAVNDQLGYFGRVPLLTVALKDWDKISKVFAVTPDTNWYAIRGMYLHHVGNNANICTLGHLKGYNLEWGIPIAPESRDINFKPWGDQYSNFNAGKILLILEGIAGLSYSVVDDTLTVCDHMPKEWDYMQVTVPIVKKGQTFWPTVYITRQLSANKTVEKTVMVTANPQSRLYVQPWLEGLNLKSTTYPNYDANQPRGHVSYAFTRSPNVTVTLQLKE